MKRLLWLVITFCGCMSGMGSSPMTMQRFQQIPIGISEDQLVAMIGKPYEVRKGRKIEQYVYIERFTTPDGLRQDRRYIVEISGSKVTNKYFIRDGEQTVEFLLRDNQ